MYFKSCLQFTRRCISTSLRLTEQFNAQRAPTFRNFNQYQPPAASTAETANDATGDYSEAAFEQSPFSSTGSTMTSSGPAGTSPRTSPYRSSTGSHYRAPSESHPLPEAATTNKQSTGGYSPFPEEFAQDYSSPTLYSGASEEPFSEEICKTLHQQLSNADIEIKPDGIVYMPESRFRRILNKAFGPGGWCLIPRSAHCFSNGILSREYALFCLGRFVSQARGHAAVQGFSNPAMASEAVRSNSLMRLCKDLGIANELWDPTFCSGWRNIHCQRRIENGRARWYKKETLEH